MKKITSRIATAVAPLSVLAIFLFSDYVSASPLQPFFEWEKRFNIIRPQAGTYPVTIYENEQVPRPYWQPGPGIWWLDDHTLLYKIDMVEAPRRHSGEALAPIVTVDLNTFEVKEIAKAKPLGSMCYDRYSQNLTFMESQHVDVHNKRESDVVFAHGRFHETLTRTTVHITEGKRSYYSIGYYDCAFRHPVADDDPEFWVEGIYKRRLPQDDGFILDGYAAPKTVASKHDVFYLSVDGHKKPIDVRTPKFDPVTNQYWYVKFDVPVPFDPSRPMVRNVTVVRHDRSFNFVSKRTYPPGPWPIGGTPDAVRDGFLFYTPIYRQNDPNRLYLLTHDGAIIEVLREEGFRGGLSVSPDGCRAAFPFHGSNDEKRNRQDKHLQRLAIIKLC